MYIYVCVYTYVYAPVHLMLHPLVSCIALRLLELYMKLGIFPTSRGALGYNSTGAITGEKRGSVLDRKAITAHPFQYCLAVFQLLH